MGNVIQAQKHENACAACSGEGEKVSVLGTEGVCVGRGAQ